MNRHALLVIFIALVGAAPLGGVARPQQEGRPTAESSEAALAQSDEAREAVELVRWALEEEGREAARELLREALAGLEEPPPGGEPARLACLLELTRLAEELGSLEEVLRLRTAVLALLAKTLPPDHPDLFRAQGILAGVKYALGDLEGARELCEEALAGFLRRPSADPVDLVPTRLNLALIRKKLGDPAGARQQEEEGLAALARIFPPEHPDILKAKANLAGTRYALGDLPGARELYQEVLAAQARGLPPEHLDLLASKLNLALVRKRLGDLAGARELEEQVLAVRTRLLPAGHLDLLKAKANLAGTLQESGDIAGAHALLVEVLDTLTPSLPPEHPDLLTAQVNVAATRKELGDVAGACALEQQVVAGRARFLPRDHPELLDAELCLARTQSELGDLAGARALVASVLAGMRTRARGLRSEATRAAREGARIELQRLFELHSSGLAADPILRRELFATLENLRLASVASVEAAHAAAEHPELAGAAREIAERRARLNDLVASGVEQGSSVEEWRARLLALAEERDRAEHELRQGLAAAGVFAGEIEAEGVAARLASGEAAVSYLRYRDRPARDAATGAKQPARDALLAFLVRPGGSPDEAIERIELGPLEDLEQLVEDWRAALGRLLVERGIGVAGGAAEEARLEDLGQRLRARLLDPILARAGEVRTLHVVLDDLLHLVPLDALPSGEGPVGERLAIRCEITLARFLRAPGVVRSEGGLTLVGGIDYDAEPGSEAPPRIDAGTPPLEAGGVRSGAGKALFPFLPGTKEETEALSTLYEQLFEREPSVLSRSAATKSALYAAAPKTRFLHLATHGWFAPETLRSHDDDLGERGPSLSWQRAAETLTGFAPETLCGLALAGANRGKDALGRVPGILTAEELASFDLRNCELAVLSACETNVGIRRAGQGIQSLQTALHAAGARTAITSLWKVDDAATRRLFELFYSKLWKEKLGKHDALWQAKMALRAEGHPPRDWAGWVLSGDPE